MKFFPFKRIILTTGLVATLAGGAMAQSTIGRLVIAEDKIDGERSASDQFYYNTQSAQKALRDGDLERASVLADQLIMQAQGLKDDWNFGNAVHLAKIIHGHWALSRGDVAEAKRFLSHAGATPGSPQLGSFGPDMLLASKLLAAGEREAVLEYLEACSAFWKNGKDTLTKWKAEINSGLTPDFGGNLRYFH